MIALDTNLLVRLLIQDDATQARAVERLVVRARRDRTLLFVSDVVLCELVWVLTRRAKQSRAAVADALERLLDTESIVVADPGVARGALTAYRGGSGDFADYVIREHAVAAGASAVVTFDRALRGDVGFKILG
ncbi:MAG TPA: type II toxin-antitoxin system VapC family toxin [Gemmatimonadaceae bacterium]|nr:type II toxin-antitoxin system VapC family toxin [Gemmatimonadaceae bacterium]